MKRDMDLVRKILLLCEEHEGGYAPQPFVVEGHPDEQVGFHVMLMAQAGLLEAKNASTFGAGPRWIPIYMTWDGFEFLDAARDDATWGKAKAAVKTAGGFGFEVLKGVLVAYIKEQASRVLGLAPPSS